MANFKPATISNLKLYQNLQENLVNTAKLQQIITNKNILYTTYSLATGNLVSTKKIQLKLAAKKQILLQLIDSLISFKQNNVYHNDLRSWNMLWDLERQQLTIIDFEDFAPGWDEHKAKLDLLWLLYDFNNHASQNQQREKQDLTWLLNCDNLDSNFISVKNYLATNRKLDLTRLKAIIKNI